MAEICDLDELPSADLPTTAQIQAIIRRIDVTIMNLISGNGTYGAVDIREEGHTSSPTQTLSELRRMRQMYVEYLNDPTQNGDMSITFSEWDNPDLPLLGFNEF